MLAGRIPPKIGNPADFFIYNPIEISVRKKCTFDPCKNIVLAQKTKSVIYCGLITYFVFHLQKQNTT